MATSLPDEDASAITWAAVTIARRPAVSTRQPEPMKVPLSGSSTRTMLETKGNV
jgi:hypothetical protein